MDDTECLICLEEFDLSPIAILSCNHKYHFNCLAKWINTKKNKYNICTICDKNVEIINIYSLNQNLENPIQQPSYHLQSIQTTQPHPTQQPEEPEEPITRQTGIFSCCTIL